MSVRGHFRIYAALHGDSGRAVRRTGGEGSRHLHGLVASRPRAVDAMLVFQSDKLKDYDHSSPIRGKPPIASDEEWLAQKPDLNHQLIAFMLDLICAGRDDELGRFIDLTKAADRPLLTQHEIDSFERSVVKQNDATGSTFGAVGKFRDGNLKNDKSVRPIVPELYIIKMRLWEILWLNQPDAERIHKIGDWVIGSWEAAMREERFWFTTPDLAEAAVYPMLAEVRPTNAGIARLLLTLALYVDVQPAPQHFKLWRKVSGVAGG